MNQGVADPRLTTWLLRLKSSALSGRLWPFACDQYRRIYQTAVDMRSTIIIVLHFKKYTKSDLIRQEFFQASS